jgi:hypothetical protein
MANLYTEGEIKDFVSRQSLPKIQTVIRDVNIKSAMGSLFVWGLINIVAWFILGNQNSKILEDIKHPDNGIYFLLYSNIIFGASMFLIAYVGLVTRHSFIIISNSLILIGIGIWNVLYEFIANSILSQYGYVIEKQGIFWVMLGMMQCFFGFRELSVYSKVTSFKPEKMKSIDILLFKKKLKAFISLNPNEEQGIVDGFITLKGFPGLSMTTQNIQYTGRIINNYAILISTKLDDYIILKNDKIKINNKRFAQISIFDY